MLKINKKLLFLPLIICLLLVVFCTFGFAGCSASKVTITLNANGGYFVVDGENVTTYTIELDAGQTVDPSDLPNPRRDPTNTTEYVYDGWSYNFDTAVTQDITVNVEWQENVRMYTVTFDANGGLYTHLPTGNTATVTAQYTYNANITAPSDPVKASDGTYNYAFAGYTPVVNNKATQSVTYVAQWTPTAIDYTLIFNANGGKINNGSTDLEYYQVNNARYGAQIALPAGYNVKAPESTASQDYVFAGWYTAPNGGQKVTTVSGNNTVYAQWTTKTRKYTVTFDAGTGKFADGSQTKSFSLDYGVTIVEPSQQPSMQQDNTTVYTFAGFGVPANTTVSEDVTYVASYTTATRYYSVTFHAGEGAYFDNPATTTKVVTGLTFEQAITQPAIEPTKTATTSSTFTFSGYNANFVSGTTEVTGDGMEFTAQYNETPRIYVVVFYAGADAHFDIEGNPSQYSINLAYGANIKSGISDIPTPVKDSTAAYTYEFAAYLNLTDTATVTGENMTYTASYTQSDRYYTVTFDANGGEFANGEGTVTQSVKYNEHADLSESAVERPTKASSDCYTYSFMEWSTESIGAGTIMSPVTDDTTYYARYEASTRTYTATFVDSNGKVIYETTYKASPFGAPKLSEDQMAALNTAYEDAGLNVRDEYGFIGRWDFTLLNANTSCYVNGEYSVYKFGDGSAQKPYLIDGLDAFGGMFKKLSEFYSNYTAATNESEKTIRYNNAKRTNYKMIADVDFTGYNTLSEDKKVSPWFIGTLSASKGNNSHYAIKGLKPEYFPATWGAMFNEIRDATVRELDIILGADLVSFASIACGDRVDFIGVDIRNAEEGASTFISKDDNNESAYLVHTTAKTTSFERCVNYANYTSEASYFGIFIGGYSDGSADYSSKLEFEGCENRGNVVSSDYVGILTGNPARRNFKSDFSTVLIGECYNYGNIAARGVGGFVGFSSTSPSGVSAEMKTVLDAMVENKDGGTMTTLTALNATLATTKTGDANETDQIVLTARSGNLAAGKYVLTVVAYAKNANSTVRVNYSFTKELAAADAATNSISFGSQYDFIDKNSYAAYTGLTLPAELTWTKMTGYNIKYLFDDANKLIVFDFADYVETDYTLNPEAQSTAYVTYYNGENILSASSTYAMASNHATVTTQQTFYSALTAQKSYIALGNDIELSNVNVVVDGAFAVINYNLNLNLNGHYLDATAAITRVFVVDGSANMVVYTTAPATSAGTTESYSLEKEDTGESKTREPSEGPVKGTPGSSSPTTTITSITVLDARNLLRANGYAFRVQNGGNLSILEGVTVCSTNNFTIFVKGTGNADNSSSLCVSGTVDCQSTLHAAISGNGIGNLGGINISINGGTVTSKEAAIYMPSSGTLTVSGNATISGTTAIYIKAGTVNLNDGTISSTHTGNKIDYVYSNDGYNVTGDAIVVDSCGYPDSPATVTISNDVAIEASGTNCAKVAHYKKTPIVDAKVAIITTTKDDYTPVVYVDGVLQTTTTTDE